MSRIIQSSGNKKFIDGYVDDKRHAGANHLSAPSQNCDITKTGEAVYSRGTIPVSFDLNNAGKASRPFNVPRYNVTFFAINGKVLFVNHNNSDAVVDTGISLSDTNGRNTRFAEYAGDIYLTNQTDGLRQIHMGLVNDAAATLGDGFITVDQDLAGRLAAFGDTTSSLRIATTVPFAETMSSVASTGVVTLSDTLDAAVPNNTVVYTVENISSGRPFASGIAFWKERMVLWGMNYETTVDFAPNVLFMSKAAIMTEIENVINFTVADTAARESIGKGGILTAVLPMRDYIYAFTKEETYYASVGDINLTTGATPFQLLTSKYGCVNEDCVADIGNGTGAFLTNNKRIIGIKISSEQGAPVVFPDELFDSPISNTNALLDSDQSDSFFFASPNDKKLYCHCNVDGSRIVQKFNTEIRVWEPPRTGWSFGGMYSMNSVTFATMLTDDDVVQCNEGFQDLGQDYEVVIATSLIEDSDGRTTLKLNSIGISGRASELATLTLENYVGEGTPQQKSFTVPSGISSGALGTVVLGNTTLGSGMGTDMSPYDKLFGISPTYGPSYQAVLRSTGAITLSSYSVYGNALSRPLLTLQ